MNRLTLDAVRSGLLTSPSAASQKPFEAALPMPLTMSMRVSFHSSSVVDRTFEMCTPRDRWTPAQSIQIMMPRLIEAQSGLEATQSAQILFGAFSRSILSTVSGLILWVSIFLSDVIWFRLHSIPALMASTMDFISIWDSPWQS